MKILILGFTKIKYMPYMNFYLDSIDVDKNDVHLLHWNRDLHEEDTSALKGVKLHEFKCYQEDDVPKLTKLLSFYKFRKYAKSVLKSDKFDLIFVLHSLTGVLIEDILRKNYAGKYIFDYRDYTYEKFEPFKKAVSSLVKNSIATFVSSDAFRKILPASEMKKIFTSHNLLVKDLEHRDEKEKHGIPSTKIRIAFWGFIRHESINTEIIKKISADDRFELHYYGREQQIAISLKQYVKEHQINNVFFHGEYEPQDRYEFIRKTDIIHNLYSDRNTTMSMGNKYYDGIIFKIPQLCMDGSYMASCVDKNNIGLTCDPFSDDFTQNVYQYYTNLEKSSFNEMCDRVLEQVYEEWMKGKKLISNLTK